MSVNTVKATDAKTVQITTKTPDVSVPNSGHFLMILPKKYYEAVGDDGFRAKPIGIKAGGIIGELSLKLFECVLLFGGFVCHGNLLT